MRDPWELRDRIDEDDPANTLQDLTDHDSPLLQSTERTVPAAQFDAAPAEASLALVEPDTGIRFRIERAPWGTLQRKAQFSVDGFGAYELLVTDPPIEARLSDLEEGVHSLDAVGIDESTSRVFLTISLSEPFARPGGVATCSKLVAALIPVPR